MTATLNQELVQEFMELLQCDGIRSVSQWKLPNHDVPFVEAVALPDARAEFDGYFELTSRAIAGIGAADK